MHKKQLVPIAIGTCLLALTLIIFLSFGYATNSLAAIGICKSGTYLVRHSDFSGGHYYVFQFLDNVCCENGKDPVTMFPSSRIACVAPDPNAGVACTNATQCKYACYVSKPANFTGTGVCTKYQSLQGRVHILDENGELIEKNNPIS